MLTGQTPFTADTPLAVIFKHVQDPLPLPRAINPDIPEAVERVILKALLAPSIPTSLRPWNGSSSRPWPSGPRIVFRAPSRWPKPWPTPAQDGA